MARIRHLNERANPLLSATFAPKFARVIDLCAAPYNLSPGGDITTAMQAVLDQIGVDKVSTDIVLSKVGTYTLNGAQQTGTTLGYNYSGQLIVPGIGPSGTAIAIRIRGGAPIAMGGSARYPGGTKIISNATSGWIMDCKGGFTAYNAAYPWTNVQLMLEDLIFQAPADPQCGGINARCTSWFQTSNFAMTTADNTSAKTGTKEAISPSQNLNEFGIVIDRTVVIGWPYAVNLTEHITLRDFRATWCGSAFVSYGGGHYNLFSHVSVEETPVIFTFPTPYSGNPVVIEGDIVIESPDVTPGQFISLGSGVNGPLTGHLNMHFQERPPLDTDAFGYANPGLNLTNMVYSDAGGWMQHNPADDFSRRNKGAITRGSIAWPSLHPWRLRTATQTIQITGADKAVGTMKKNSGSSAIATIPAKRNRWGGVSRSISATFTLDATSPHVKIIADWIGGGTNDGRHLWLDVFATAFRLGYNNGADVTLADGGSVVSAGGTYTVTLEVTHRNGVPVRLVGYVDGVQKVSSPVPAAMGALVPTGTLYPYISDGLAFYDTNSACSLFVVRDENPQSALRTGTATLAAGTVTVTDANITTASVIRLNRQAAGGTLGQLSVALTAGTSFTINSSSGTETSTVYYEVVSY